MALDPTKTLQPPFYDPPIADYPSGQQHSQAWTEYHQSVSDRLEALGSGVTDGSEAGAGQVGEFQTATGGAVTLSNNVAVNTISLPLTAGDWDVSGTISFNPAVTTHPTQIAASLSLVSNTLGATNVLSAAFNVGAPLSLSPPQPKRYLLSAPATVYLVALSTFTTAGMSATGSIWARRAR